MLAAMTLCRYAAPFPVTPAKAGVHGGEAAGS